MNFFYGGKDEHSSSCSELKSGKTFRTVEPISTIRTNSMLFHSLSTSANMFGKVLVA